METKNMDTKKKESIGCLLSTIIIIAIIIIGFFFFTRSFTAILATACMFILPILPFYYLHKNRQFEKNLKKEDDISKNIEAYANELKNLAINIENYNSAEYKESSNEYLKYIKDEIVSVAKKLKEIKGLSWWNI